jgi:hypothetical protein
LASVDIVVGVGAAAQETIAGFAVAVNERAPQAPPRPDEGDVLVWFRAEGHVIWLTATPPRTTQHRHRRKYAQGELGEDKSFYFRGPGDRLNLRAQNLMLFKQIADGVDDETWLHHLKLGDYSRWFADSIKDDELADEARELEQRDVSAAESRAAINEMIDRRYTAPA